MGLHVSATSDSNNCPLSSNSGPGFGWDHTMALAWGGTGKWSMGFDWAYTMAFAKDKL